MTKLSDLLQRNLSSIFNERDEKKRIAAVRSLWTADGVLWSAEGTYVGHKAIAQAAATILRRYPEFDFSVVGNTDEIPEAGRMRWSLGVPGSRPAITGMDVVVASNGRIMSMYRFLDGAEL